MILKDPHFQSPFIKTEPVKRPKPTVEISKKEFKSIEDIPKDQNQAVGFSGGQDSLIASHKAMKEGIADYVLHIDTGTNLTATIDFVRNVCDKYDWPLIIIPTTESVERYFCRYGPPDPPGHNSAFWTLKGRALNQISKHLTDQLTLITGAYRNESDRRMENVKGEINNPDYCSWRYKNIIWDWEDNQINDYFNSNNLPQSPTKKTIHRSGDCQCLAFGNRDEIYIDIAANYPEDFAYLRNIEKRFQEYRGRLLFVKDQFPGIYDIAKETWRKQHGNAYLTLDQALEKYAKGIFDWALDIDKEYAIANARKHKSNYLGHGTLSDSETDLLLSNSDIENVEISESDISLCEFCTRSDGTVSKEIIRSTQEAESLLDQVDISRTPKAKSKYSKQRLEPDGFTGFLEVSGKAQEYAQKKFPDAPLWLAIAVLLYTEGEYGGHI